MQQHARKGFSLVEAIIYVAILGTIATVLVQFLLQLITTREHYVSSSSLSADARLALETIEREVRQADSISVANSTFNADPGVLEIATSDAQTNPTVIQLDADDGRLQIKKGAGSFTYLTSSDVRVTNLVFSYNTVTSSHENIQMIATFDALYGAGVEAPQFSVTSSASVRK